MFNIDNVPQNVRASLDAFTYHGRPTGGFLRAVLANDLMKAAMKADATNRMVLVDIVGCVVNRVPAAAWGSYTKVEAWAKAGGLNGEIERQKVAQPDYEDTRSHHEAVGYHEDGTPFERQP